MNKSELLLEIEENINSYDKNMEEGMTHEEGYDWAEIFRDLLIDVINKLKVIK